MPTNYDLDYKLRFNFVLVTGILMTNNEPKSNLLNLILSIVLIKEIDNLNNKNLFLKINAQKVNLKFQVFCGSVDTVCRPIIQNRILFNGYHGCSYCYQHGEYIHSVRGVRYTFHQDSIDRSKASHADDVMQAVTCGNCCRDVKGPSVFLNIENFDITWSLPYEYMHSLLLGATYQIWNEWKRGTSDFRLKKK